MPAKIAEPYASFSRVSEDINLVGMPKLGDKPKMQDNKTISAAAVEMSTTIKVARPTEPMAARIASTAIFFSLSSILKAALKFSLRINRLPNKSVNAANNTAWSKPMICAPTEVTKIALPTPEIPRRILPMKIRISITFKQEPDILAIVHRGSRVHLLRLFPQLLVGHVSKMHRYEASL